MAMRTAEEYLAKLRTMRPNVYLDGELVSRDDPRIMPGINVICETFNFGLDPAHENLMTATSHLTGEKISRFTHIHQSTDDLLKKQEMTRMLCTKTGGCIQRCMGVDAMNALSVITKEMDLALGTTYYARFLDFLAYVQKNDLVANCAQTDVKGDRMLRPHEQQDPDLYLRIVDQNEKGIVINGAKAHNTIAPYADEIIVVPTRAMTKNDGDWAVAFAVPGDTEGVSLIVRATAPRARKRLEAPIATYGGVDSLTVFDHVFVPWERVFMCRETQFAGKLAGLFANFHRHSYTGCKPATTDVLLGAAALVSEYNGIEKAPHVREKLATLVATAELVYGAGVAAGVQGQKAASGTYVPDATYCNVARYHAGVNIYHEYDIVTQLAGGLPATLPFEADFYHEKTGPYLEKYMMRKAGISAENQHRCFRMLGDILCSSMAGVMQVAGVHGGGSPMMEQIAIMSQYDINSKKNIAKALAGIKTDDR